MSEKIVQLNEAVIKSELKELVRGSVEETLNELLEAEAEKLTQAARYERNEQRQGYRSGHYNRSLTTTSGDVTLKVPKLKGISFETAIIERYRRRESSVEEALIEMYLAGVSVRRVLLVHPRFVFYGELSFLDFFPAEMFDLDFVHLHSLSIHGKLFVHHAFVRVILHGKFLHQGHRRRLVLDQMTASEDHNALHKRSPGLFPDRFISEYGEAYLVASLDRVYFVPRPCPVKIDLPVFCVIQIVDRDGVRIAVVPIYSQNPSPGILEKTFYGISANFIFLFPNGTKHRITPNSYI